jgi:hypothetical protein
MIGFPLLLIPLAIYNIIAFLMREVSFDRPIFQLPLMSGDEWPVALRDLLLVLSIVLLLFEVIKGARPGAKYLTDHFLSALVFIAAAAEFVLLPRFGTSTFFLLTTLALVEFFSGIALRARRGSHVVTSATPPSQKPLRPPVTDPPEPQFEPAVAPAPVAAAKPIVGPDPVIVQPEPVVLHAGNVSSGPSPEIHSPDLQPDDVNHPPSQPSSR